MQHLFYFTWLEIYFITIKEKFTLWFKDEFCLLSSKVEGGEERGREGDFI